MGLLGKKVTVTSSALHQAFDRAQADLIGLGTRLQEQVEVERTEASERIQSYAKLIADEERNLSRLAAREAEVTATVALLVPYANDWQETPVPTWDAEHIVPAATENVATVEYTVG